MQLHSFFVSAVMNNFNLPFFNYSVFSNVINDQRSNREQFLTQTTDCGVRFNATLDQGQQAPQCCGSHKEVSTFQIGVNYGTQMV